MNPLMKYNVCARYSNTCDDRQVGQPIVALGLRYMIGRTFYCPNPSTDYINTGAVKVNVLTQIYFNGIHFINV